MNAAKILTALAAGLAAVELTKKQENTILLPVLDVLNTWAQNPISYDSREFVSDLNTWMPPDNAGPYIARLHAAERRYGIPENLLVRVAYQESRFRDDIITGKTVSYAGAVGIMQIVPRWHPEVDPLDVSAAIDYAGKYLKSLYNRFGSWRLALAAYNWGQGNLSNKGIENAPRETRDYINQIAGDVLKGIA
jgi:Transglycosylase SLT domain